MHRNAVVSRVAPPERYEREQQRSLRVQPVLRLVEYEALLGFNHFFRNLLPPVGGKTMQYDRVRRRFLHQRPVYLKCCEVVPSLLRLGFLSHRRPYISVNHIRVSHRFMWIVYFTI
jgi:hypothetical protein